MRTLITLLALFLSAMAAEAGDFFPADYKRFPFKEGDLLASQRSDGKISVNKILRVDRFTLKKGEAINIQGRRFVATEDDYLLVVSASYGKAEFTSLEQARTAALAGTWSVQIEHVPNRPPGAAAGQSLLGNAPVTEEELRGYRAWRNAFEKGEAGVF